MRLPTILLISILPLLAGTFSQEPGRPARLTIEGFLFCVGDTASARETHPCSRTGERYALKDQAGILHLFSPTDPRTAIFADPRVFGRKLRIEAEPRGASREQALQGAGELEITDLHAVEDGKLIRLYYHCDVCNIDSYAPGPCWCCQREFEFREEVVDQPQP